MIALSQSGQNIHHAAILLGARFQSIFRVVLKLQKTGPGLKIACTLQKDIKRQKNIRHRTWWPTWFRSARPPAHVHVAPCTDRPGFGRRRRTFLGRPPPRWIQYIQWVPVYCRRRIINASQSPSKGIPICICSKPSPPSCHMGYIDCLHTGFGTGSVRIS
jgi:hypothetical protein